MRTLSATLLAAQQSNSRTPAVRVLINSVNYSSRVLYMEYAEEPYRDYASILLNNADRGLNSVSTSASNLLGYRFRIALGYQTGTIVAEPNGDGAGKEYVEYPDLWVKSQKMISQEGHLFCELFCEGQWTFLREQHIMALEDAIQKGDSAEVGSDPYFAKIIPGTKTIYDLVKSTIENVLGGTIGTATEDGTINTFKPVISVEELPFAAVFLERLIRMTKSYLRPKANLVWDVVFPQAGDAVNETYYSDSIPYFRKSGGEISLVVPNRIIIYAGNPEKKKPWPTPVIVGDSGAYSGNYVEVIEHIPFATITIQADADKMAAALLTRYNNEKTSGEIIVNHDCRVELYDKVEVIDSRT